MNTSLRVVKDFVRTRGRGVYVFRRVGSICESFQNSGGKEDDRARVEIEKREEREKVAYRERVK